ncbi:SET and MYND domain-containing protein 4 [Lampris incognitus]|uniref:SET and MYND domain-containing protein 4 n=1 Tax=Lampris incognitus TaxID=2546036 RepID=UPI0024B52BFC|nr:SET and MYND domain-containing protein 4 [Lampris incognitus]
MDLPRPQWQDHVAQKWTGLDSDLKQRFASLMVIDDVFKCALTHTTHEDLGFLQSISKQLSVHKDTDEATQCRGRGNSSFKTRDYTAAALHYSKGVCFAPQSSEQLSLCYANRSAALFHLQRYQDSLNDIDRALKHGYPSHLQHKLQERRLHCLNHLSVAQRGNQDDPKCASEDQREPQRGERLNVKPTTDHIDDNVNLICHISPQAAVCFSPEKGRHLVVTERIAAGEVILTDRPYSSVLIPGTEELKGKEKRNETENAGLFGTEDRCCHRCLRETVCPVPCDECSYSRYCSSRCQREAWEEHHRWECPLGAELMVLGLMSQLALRVTVKAGLRNVEKAREPNGDKNHKGSKDDSVPFHSRESEPSASYHGDPYLNVYHLMHHLNSHSPILRFLWAVTTAALYLILIRTRPPPASWDLSKSSTANSQSQGPADETGTAGWSSEPWLLGSTILRHMLQLRCNAQAVSVIQHTGGTNSAVQSSQEIRIATALFPTLSLLNHSCRPNTSLVFSTGAGSDLDPSVDPDEGVAGFGGGATSGITISVRAARVISRGQEVLHCYGPHSSRMMLKERQRLLQEQYYFECTCEACNLQQEDEGSEGSCQGPGLGGGPKDSGLQCGKCKGPLKRRGKDRGPGLVCLRSSCRLSMSDSEVSRSLQEVRNHLEKAVDLMERDRPDEALRLLQRTSHEAGLILTETHPLQGELADAMARAHATLGDWTSAASQMEQSVVATGSQYGEDSIELSRQLFKLAQLHFNSGAIGSALSVIPKVRPLLCLHFGPDCPELQELQAIEDCLHS